VVRRLVTVLMLWGCLLGIIQPAVACGPEIGCCPKGAPCATQVTLPTAAGLDCCAAQAAVTASAPVVAQPHKSFELAAGSAGLPIAVTANPVLRPRASVPSPGFTNFRADFSLTYLYTARLRL
jgi:hypothetical protein